MGGGELLAILLLVSVCGLLLLGYPVAFTLAGVGVLFAGLGIGFEVFNWRLFAALPSRYFGVMTNEVLVAVPLFVFMGVMLERSKIAEDLLVTLGQLFGRLRGGLGISVTLVGAVLAASTGIVGATVIAMGLLSLPTMLRAGYDHRLACGTICASGTLGQIIPPSIALVLLGDVLAGTYSESQLARGIVAVKPFSVIDLFAGAFIPGLVLVALYVIYLTAVAFFQPQKCPPLYDATVAGWALARKVATALIPPAFLVIAVLGSILAGLATPSEAASFGAVGATLLALLRRQLSLSVLREVVQVTTRITCMVFGILLGASVFSLTFRGLGGDRMVAEFFTSLPGGFFSALLLIMIVVFLLGFILDFIEIVFIVVPIVAPALLMMDVNPIWLGVMFAMNLQTSFLTPPFGWALFYLRGVAPAEVRTGDIYRGILPFVLLQLVALAILAQFPALATWLPSVIFD
ncbi:TRAP transporter large permease [Pelomicrobium sp.]|jgi:tripartite ATP-independent transporter DctM subunit|uniref:TRAP transporter large permease n=1 Tax=Pelomicrobium sp. TaxID=2815319 RepID=UPI002FDDFEF2